MNLLLIQILIQNVYLYNDLSYQLIFCDHSDSILIRGNGYHIWRMHLYGLLSFAFLPSRYFGFETWIKYLFVYVLPIYSTR